MALRFAKILQTRLPQYMNHELPDVQAGFRKGIAMRDLASFPVFGVCFLVSGIRDGLDR